MNALIYQNVETLSYGELLSALERIKQKMNEDPETTPEVSSKSYYNALVAELDKRQREIV
jgi:hypothetical protein